MYSINEMKQALLKSDFENFKKKLENYDANEFDGFGNNILHLYIKERKRIDIDYKRIIDVLMKRGLDIEGKVSNKYVFGTVLQLAVSMKQKDIFDYLIDCGANVNATNSYGNSILITAIMNYNNDDDGYYIKKLIECKANIYQENNRGISPISLVNSFDNNDVKKYFLFLDNKIS